MTDRSAVLMHKNAMYGAAVQAVGVSGRKREKAFCDTNCVTQRAVEKKPSRTVITFGTWKIILLQLWTGA